jgi:hypothetical protein
MHIRLFMLIFDLNRPILAYQRTKTCLYLSALFVLTIADTPLYACQAFLCLSVDELLRIMSIIVKKKSIYLKTTLFSRAVCPV